MRAPNAPQLRVGDSVQGHPCVMESPPDEQRAIEDYLYSQSDEGFEVDHVEKLTSEFVLGHEYDVWDAHTNEGRWWVITNPTNLYSQDAIKSMDVALSFHIGLMLRVLARQPARRAGTSDEWLLDVLRRVDLAQERLDTAKEVEDFQSVGVRLREALVSLAVVLSKLIDGDYTEEPPKVADFKGWASIAAEVIAGGADRAQLRGLLKATSEKTWGYVNWLTHARRATPLDARIGLGAVTEVVELFVSATSEWRMGTPPRCPTCGSYQLKLDFHPDDGWFSICRTCGWMGEADGPATALCEPNVGESPSQQAKTESPAPADQSECVVIEDFGIYLTPRTARAMMEEMQERLPSGDGPPAPWANFFAVERNGSLADAHRVVFEEVRGAASPAAELVYKCNDSDLCVNPHHAREVTLPADLSWTPVLIREATVRPGSIELRVDFATGPSKRLFMSPDVFDSSRITDASALPERVLMVSTPGSNGWTNVVVAEQRSNLRYPTILNGWVHPEETPEASDACPCSSGSTYAECHGAISPETQ